MKSSNGLFICFTGIDGSGKTTLAKSITQFLKDRDLPAEYIYARFQLIISKPLVILGNKLFLRKCEINKDYANYSLKKKNLSKNHEILSRIYLYSLLMDYLLQLIIKIRIPLMLGKVIVCDRYVYDTVLTDFHVDMNFSMKQSISLVNKCFEIVPIPTKNFLVDVIEETAFKRKNDIPSLEYLKDRRSAYLQIAEYYSMTVLNGNNNAEQVFKECYERLINELGI